MTRRQAAVKAQELATETGREAFTFGRSPRRWVAYPLSWLPPRFVAEVRAAGQVFEPAR